MNKSIKLMPIIPKKVRSMYSGINLIGLMISSVLGIFIISVIIKISMTINNNLQLIQAYIELEQSARILQKFFENIFDANGNGLDTNSRTNDYFIDSTNNTARFSMWYKGSVDGLDSGRISSAISCSGRQLSSDDTSDNQITVFMNNYVTSNNSGYITCKNGNNSNPTDSDHPREAMPLVNSQQVVQFFIAAIVADPSTAKLQIIPINYTNATKDPPPTGYNSIGIKLAILLRSTQRVFNIPRKVEFTNILN
ncbi:MAG: hypothetical protein ACR2HS_04320, partial [Gammaproteobacteria bacterium]